MTLTYKAAPDRYEQIPYRRCGESGLLLPAISLGLWHNFGNADPYEDYIQIVHTAFDRGITHFDLANNYGPPPGAAETNFGRILKSSLAPYRDEIIISTKAGHDMWAGPYGSWGSRKHLTASIDQSLKRLGTDYVDIFYSHRPDPSTPIEETVRTLSDIVRQGKALYIGLSKYNEAQTLKAAELLEQAGTPCIIHQDRYSLFDRHLEDGLMNTIARKGMGLIVFSPLAQGLLTNRYLNGIPENSRAAKATGFLRREQVTDEKINQARQLEQLAKLRGQSLAEMSLAWLLRKEMICSVIIGASSTAQLTDNLQSIRNTSFSEQELSAIENIVNQQ